MQNIDANSDMKIPENLYLWTAISKDDEAIFQFPDESNYKVYPGETNFKEVLDLEKDNDLKFFILYDKYTRIYVDLTNGYFNIGGFFYHPCPELERLGKKIKYRIVYYRRKRTSTANLNKQWVHRYLIGWQVIHEGKNYQRIIFLDPINREITIKEKR